MLERLGFLRRLRRDRAVTGTCLLIIVACAIDERPELRPGAGGDALPDAPEQAAGGQVPEPSGQEPDEEPEDTDAGTEPDPEGDASDAGELGMSGGPRDGAAGSPTEGGSGGKAGSRGSAGSAGRGGSRGGSGSAGKAGSGGTAGAGSTGGVSGGAGLLGSAGSAPQTVCGDGQWIWPEECDPGTGPGATRGRAAKGTTRCSYDCRVLSNLPCTSCAETNCLVFAASVYPDKNGDCLFEGLATLDTPEEREACQNLSACFKATDCAYDARSPGRDPLRCFCGSKGPSSNECGTWAAGTADGACAREIEAAFGTTNAAAILEKWRDTSYSAGATAINRLYCDVDACLTPCGY